MAWIAAGTAAVGLASSIYGGIKSSKDNQQAENQVDQYGKDTEAFYNKRINQDFLQTNAAKGLVEQMKERYRKQAKEIESKAATTGSTPEAEIAAKTTANDEFNNSLNSVAQQGTYYQLQNEQNYQNSLADLFNKKLQINRMKNQNASNLMGIGSQLMGTAGDIGSMDKEK